jgi:hypothetical protein
MPTFIDESGDTGPVSNGGTRYFRLAAVWIPTNSDVLAFREKVKRIRLELELPKTFEFKFAKTSAKPEWREAYFAAAMSQEFRFVVSSINKSIGPVISTHEAQHWACVTEIAAMLRSVYHQAEECRDTPLKELVVIDNNDDRRFLAMIKQQLRALESRRRPGSSMIGTVCFRNSAAHEELQLADMICGAVGAAIDGNDSTWYNKIASRDLCESRHS